MNLRRRNLILDLMAEQGFVTRDAAVAAKALPVTSVQNGGMSAPSPYFIDVVRNTAGTQDGTEGTQLFVGGCLERTVRRHAQK